MGLLVILKAFWPYVLGALLLGGGLTYLKVLHAEINHYKTQAVEAKQELATYKQNMESMQTALKSSNSALTLELKQAEIARNAAVEAQSTEIKKRIDSDETLRKYKLSHNAVQLFNDSTRDPRSVESSPTNPVDVSDSDTSLADLLIQANNNDKEHWKCIEQVEDWQKLWSKYKQNLQAAKGASR